MGEKVAASGLATAVTLFGLTLTDLGEIVRIIAGLCAAVSALAAAYYYWKKASK